jgi:hypothetical protein
VIFQGVVGASAVGTLVLEYLLIEMGQADLIRIKLGCWGVVFAASFYS